MRNRMSEQELTQVEYRIVQGDFHGHFLFNYWMEHWPKLVKALGSDETLHPQEFLKQQYATALLFKGKVVGIHLLKEYSAKDFRKDPYFEPYSESFFRNLESRGVRTVIAQQYFMVDEEFSVSKTLVNFGAIIASLSLKHQSSRGIDATVTLARADIPVTSLGLKLGFEEIERTEMHNVPVSMLACFNPKPHPKEDVWRWADHYWQNRQHETTQPARQVA